MSTEQQGIQRELSTAQYEIQEAPRRITELEAYIADEQQRSAVWQARLSS